jgi:hypothetical protein
MHSWLTLEDVGLIAESGAVANFSPSEAVWLREVNLYAIMTMAMSGSLGKYEVPPQICTGMPSGGILQKWGLDHPLYFDDPRFSFLKKLDTTTSEAMSSRALSTLSLSFWPAFPRRHLHQKLRTALSTP